MAFALNPDEFKKAVSTELDINADHNADWIADVLAAYTRLWDSYGPFTAAGVNEETMKTIQSDAWWKEFSTKMRAFLYHVEDTTPEEVNYVWILYWFSGMKPEEVYDLFYRSCAENEKANTQLVQWTSPEEIESKLGDYITGVIGMTQSMENGFYVSSYDYKTGYPCDNLGGGKWQKAKYAIKAMPGLEGKVTAIENALVPRYGCGPLAGFMDSSGDFNLREQRAKARACTRPWRLPR